MHVEIENLINIALADGTISEKEKEILFRKAIALGEDPEELEMILQGRLLLLEKEKKETSSKQTTKLGEIKKCPACGSPTKAFETICKDCGHEFKEVAALSSKQRLYEDLNNAEREEKQAPLSVMEKLQGPQAVNLRINQRKASIIASFPLPNTKEDILEFFNWSIHESNKEETMLDDGFIKKAWKAKSNELASKIKLELHNDPHAKLLLAEYEKNKKKISIGGKTKVIIICASIFVLLFFFVSYMVKQEKQEEENEIKKIDHSEQVIKELIDQKKYDAALIEAENINWSVRPQANKELVKQYDQKRENLKKIILELKENKQ